MTSWFYNYNPWFEIGWSLVQLFVLSSRGRNRWANFKAISSLKGLLVLWFALQIAFKAAADRWIGFYAPISVRTSSFFAARAIYIEVVCSLLDSEPGFSLQCHLFLCNWIYAVANQGIGLYSQNIYQNQRVLRKSSYIEVACSLLDSEPGFSLQCYLFLCKVNFMR